MTERHRQAVLAADIREMIDDLASRISHESRPHEVLVGVLARLLGEVEQINALAAAYLAARSGNHRAEE